MHIKFELETRYRVAAVNYNTNNYVATFELYSRKEAEKKLFDMKECYKGCDGWKLSLEKGIFLILGKRTKQWISKLYYKPKSFKYYIKHSHFVLEPKFSLNW